MQTRLSRRSGHFEGIVEGLPAMVALYGADGQIVYSNRLMLEYLDQTLEQLREGLPAYIYHADDQGEVLRRWRSSVRTGAPYDVEGRLRRADGVYRWHRIRGFPLGDAGGRIDLWYGHFTDIDDTKQAEAKLAAEKQLLELMARGVALPEVLSAICLQVEMLAPSCVCSIFLVDGDAQKLRVGAGPSLPDDYRIRLDGKPLDPRDGPMALAAAEKLPIIAADVIHDQRWAASRWPQLMVDAGFASCWSTPILTAGEHVAAVFALFHREPQVPTAGEQELIDRFTHIAGIALERARADAVLREREVDLDLARAELAHVSRFATLSTLTASIAHEINQPLAGITTNANTCLRMLAAASPNLEGVRATAQRTIRDSDRAAQVIKRLRAMFSKRPESREPVDLNDAAREVIALSTGELQRGRVAVRMELADDLPAVVGDRVQLQQVILNLALNAAQAMSSVDDRARDLTVISAPDGAAAVRLSIRDAGVGVAPQSVETLFEAFHTTKPTGMGVGLSISRSIIESHGGRLWAEPNAGPGATFAFSLPVEASVGAANAS